MVDDLDYEGIKFPISKKNHHKIEPKNKICLKSISLWKWFDFSCLYISWKI